MFSVAVLFLLACVLVKAQTPVQVDPKTASQHLLEHLLEHPQADYPPIAYAAHVYGTVVIAVTIDQTGHIWSARVVSGPAMLQQAALDAIERYTYTPFQADGKPVSVDSQISVNFGVNSQPHVPKGLGNFLQDLKSCEQQIDKPGKPADQVKTCGHAAQLADGLPDDAPFRDRITAYVQYATALIRDGKAADAVPVGNKAIAMSKQLPEILRGLCASYEVTGEASAVAGNLTAADEYLTQAEDCESSELQLSTTPPLKQHDSQVMKGLLQFHAKVLTAMGNHTAAEEKLNQAAKL
jgi:TonB family protein